MLFYIVLDSKYKFVLSVCLSLPTLISVSFLRGRGGKENNGEEAFRACCYMRGCIAKLGPDGSVVAKENKEKKRDMEVAFFFLF